MKGQHRPPSRSAGSRIVIALVTLVLLAAVGAGGWYGLKRLPKESAAAGCRTESTLSIAAAPEIAPAVKAVASQWNTQQTVVEGGCVQVSVAAVQPSDMAAAIAATANVSVNGLGKPNGGTAVPDVWIPDSSTWLQRLAGASKLLNLSGTSIASSPIVVAVPAPVAAALSAGGKSVTWTDLLAKLSSGAVRPGIVDPNVDASGLAALLAVGAATQAAQPSGSTVVKATSPAASDAQTALVGAIRALAAGESELRDDLMNRFPRASDAQTLARSLSVAPVPEQALLAYNAARPPVPLVGIYLNPAPQALDYPFTPMQDLPAAKAAAAAQFASTLTGPSWRDTLAAQDLRSGDGTYGAKMPTVPGMPAGPFPATPAIPASALDQALATWSAVTVPGRMLAVIDVSGSMATPVPSAGGATREDVTISAAGQGLSLFDDQWSVGLWMFSTNLDGAKPYRQLAPIAPLATNRTKMVGALPKIKPVPNGSTGLYDTVLAAYKAVQHGWDPTRVNTVVIMTDGQNDNPGGLTLTQLLAQIKKIADPARPIEVIAIGIGTDVSKVELTKIATATGGGAFVTSDPSNIADIFLEAISLRPGTAGQ